MLTDDPWLETSARLNTLEFLVEIVFARDLANLSAWERKEAAETISHLARRKAIVLDADEKSELLIEATAARIERLC